MFLRIRQIRGAIRTMRRLYLSYYALNRISIITLIIITRESCSESARRTWPRTGPDFPPSPRFFCSNPCASNRSRHSLCVHRLPNENNAIFNGDCPSPALSPFAPSALAASAAACGPAARSTNLSNAPVNKTRRQSNCPYGIEIEIEIEIDSPARTKSPHSAAEFLTKLPNAAAAFARVLSSSSPNNRTKGGTATLNSGYNASE